MFERKKDIWDSPTKFRLVIAGQAHGWGEVPGTSGVLFCLMTRVGEKSMCRLFSKVYVCPRHSMRRGRLEIT